MGWRTQLLFLLLVLEYDDSRFPLVVFTNRHEFTGQDAVAFEDLMAELLGRGERFGTVFVSIDVKMPEPRVLRRLSKWMKEAADQRREWEVCAAVYLSSTFIRSALRFINQLSPPPAPQEVFGDRDEAVAWVLERLDRDRAAAK